ncbi:MAG: DUF4231 domain-containing protein [Rhodobacteraceae bacterium]|nr:DUF4231 domain-containing protein [Paracoccaceae bacterium]
MPEKSDSGYLRLEEQIDWYDKKSGTAQRNFKLTKYATISFAAAIPIISIYEFNLLVAILGALIAVL